MPQALPMIVAFILALAISYRVTPFVRSIALRFGMVDRPSSRREKDLKPRLGGTAMYVAFTVAIL
ncbi:MAG: undecaprenyl/decaprenyl-phosphate alpha-N-acetylglucosaminyl 1-phosphate transferase, partial [Chloroflexota bacterium]